MRRRSRLRAGHVAAFDWLGAVPAQCVYDNAQTAEVRILT